MTKDLSIVENEYPVSHKPVDAEAEALLKEYTGWALIPWQQLGLFEDVLAQEGIRLVTSPLKVYGHPVKIITCEDNKVPKSTPQSTETVS